jgi:hypothetical protein
MNRGHSFKVEGKTIWLFFRTCRQLDFSPVWQCWSYFLEYLLAIQRYFGAGGGSQVVEHRPCKFEALSSNPGTAKRIEGYFFHPSRLHVLLPADVGTSPFAVHVPQQVQLWQAPITFHLQEWLSFLICKGLVCPKTQVDSRNHR